jgi:hypothetical protein
LSPIPIKTEIVSSVSCSGKNSQSRYAVSKGMGDNILAFNFIDSSILPSKTEFLGIVKILV